MVLRPCRSAQDRRERKHRSPQNARQQVRPRCVLVDEKTAESWCGHVGGADCYGEADGETGVEIEVGGDATQCCVGDADPACAAAMYASVTQRRNEKDVPPKMEPRMQTQRTTVEVSPAGCRLVSSCEST